MLYISTPNRPEPGNRKQLYNNKASTHNVGSVLGINQAGINSETNFDKLNKQNLIHENSLSPLRVKNQNQNAIYNSSSL